MADKKVSELSAITNLSGDDLLLVVNDPSGTPTSNKVTVSNLFANVVPDIVHKGTFTSRANTVFTGTQMTVSANTTFSGNLRLTSDTPASNNASSEGYGVGSIWFDADYLYVATASGTIKRVALEVFS
jgi:hypothetical protein